MTFTSIKNNALGCGIDTIESNMDDVLFLNLKFKAERNDPFKQLLLSSGFLEKLFGPFGIYKLFDAVVHTHDLFKQETVSEQVTLKYSINETRKQVHLVKHS